MKKVIRLLPIYLPLFYGIPARAAAQKPPCGWAVPTLGAARLDHPEWPRQIVPNGQSCGTTNADDRAAADKTVLVKTAQTMLLTFDSAHGRTMLRVTALESGRAGELIRCRSSLGGSLGDSGGGVIFLGRIVDAESLAMVGEQKVRRW